MDYKKYLAAHHKDCYKQFNDFNYIDCTASDRWSDLENSLTINYEELMDEAIQNYYPDLDNDSDSRWSDLEVDIDEQTKFINNFTGTYFYEWINNIDYSNPQNMLKLDKKALYITFNYTNTLEDIYQINKNSIYHIHGDISNPNFNIQFGSIENNSTEIKNYLEKKYSDIDFFSASIEPGIYHITDYCKVSFKNLQSNYTALKKLLLSNTIDEVIILGHSILGIDFPYYRDVIVPLLCDCKWTFYYHNDIDYNDIRNFVESFKIQDYRILKW